MTSKPKPRQIFSLTPLGIPFPGDRKAAESKQPKMTDEQYAAAVAGPTQEAWRIRMKRRMLGEKEGGAMSGS